MNATETSAHAGEAIASVATVSARIAAEGGDAWKLWLFEFVDEFRRRPGPGLVAGPPCAGLTDRSRCLLASTVESLCAEQGLQPPAWCAAVGSLPTPWFPSETENLKATALVESPVYFRKRNLFVLGNFLSRA